MKSASSADTIRRRGGSSGSATCCSLSSAETFKLPPPTKGPWWGHSRCGLGAVGAVLEPFCGRLSPKVDEIFQKLLLIEGSKGLAWKVDSVHAPGRSLYHRNCFESCSAKADSRTNPSSYSLYQQHTFGCARRHYPAARRQQRFSYLLFTVLG